MPVQFFSNQQNKYFAFCHFTHCIKLVWSSQLILFSYGQEKKKKTFNDVLTANYSIHNYSEIMYLVHRLMSMILLVIMCPNKYFAPVMAIRLGTAQLCQIPHIIISVLPGLSSYTSHFILIQNIQSIPHLCL